MTKIISFRNLDNELKNIKKPIVLTGGCFDILHVGHIKFLKEASKLGDSLLILLESDKKVRNLKGQNRPYFPQKDRAEVLSALSFVDYVILLPFVENDGDYSQIISKIKPAIIAVTTHDPIMEKKKRQAGLVGGKIEIIPYVKTFSSSQIAKLLGIE